MTKEMLLKLNKQLQQGEITMLDILQLKEFTDEEINIILNSNNPMEIKSLLIKGKFKSYPKDMQKILIDIINKKYHGRNRFAINCLATDVATNDIALLSGKLIQLTRIVQDSIGISQARTACRIACDYYAVISGKVVELTQMVSQFKPKSNEDEYLNLIFVASTDSYITRSGRVVEIINSMIEVNDKEEATKIYYHEQEASKKIKLISALKNGKITEVDFWNSFYENSEETIKLLDNLPIDEELGSTITISKSPRTKRIRVRLKNRTHHLN